MSIDPQQSNRTQPIPFNTITNEEQPNSVPPSINNFPSNTDFNYGLPQLQSAASLNYNQEANPFNTFPSDKEFQQEEQVQELQKVSLEKNDIDQDEILRMFREEQNRMQNNKKQSEKRKPHPTTHSQHPKDKKSTSHHTATKKQPTSGQDLHAHRRRQPTQQPLLFISKTSSFKDLKSQPQWAGSYFSILSSDALRELLIQYKIQYRSSVYDPDWQKERYKVKEAFFEQLCIGVEEMRQKPEGELTPQETEVLEKIKQLSAEVIKMPYDFGVFKQCRNLVIQIDIQLFLHFHQKSKQPLSKDYKAQYKILIANLKDPQNYQLRQKILTKKMDADMLKVANQIQLLTESKRNQIKSKQQKLLKEFSVDHERTMLKPEFQNQKEEQRITQSISYGPTVVLEHNQNQAQPQPNQTIQAPEEPSDNASFSIANLMAVNKYVDESTLSQLEELLSEDHLQRMRTRLDEDLKGQCRQRMLRRFDSLIIGRI